MKSNEGRLPVCKERVYGVFEDRGKRKGREGEGEGGGKEKEEGKKREKGREGRGRERRGRLIRRDLNWGEKRKRICG